MPTVLVVDDEPDIVLFARVNLEMSGYRVLAAGHGAEALEVVAADRPDVVLLDVMMPGIDGWTVLERLKADPATRTLPVVMMTALGGDQDQAKGGIEGAIMHLVKPVTPDELLAAIDLALHGDPEPVQRRRAQHGALTKLARLERGDAAAAPSGPRPRLTRLEHEREPAREAAAAPVVDLSSAPLTDKQHELVAVLSRAPSVSAAAVELGMSRSNVYASLRRIGRKLGQPDITELLSQIRAGATSPEG